MSHRFPLLFVPQLVLTEIIKFLKPAELVTLSLCSKRCRILVKIHRKKSTRVSIQLFNGHVPRVGVCINTNNNSYNVLGSFGGYRFHFESANKEKYKKIENLVISGHMITCAIDQRTGYSVTFWDDNTQGLKIITDYVCNLFRSTVRTVSIDQYSSWIVDWINKKQKSPINRMIINDHMDDLKKPNLLQVLRSFRGTEKLLIVASPPKLFKFPYKFEKVSTLIIKNGFWLTVDNLIDLDCVSMKIKNTNLSSLEINMFLLNWMTGSSRLRCFQIEVTRGNFNEVIKDVEHLIELFEGTRVYKWDNIADIHFHGGYNIRRDDGITATISVGPKLIIFAVWPDWQRK
ncbi:hypothetical protein CRE_20729 [Caenorhabditis remanei]|uniref:F-box domain-containing protein n=1 Tax=Caenorhabditis remanei TaxID=31234 RepID=E3MFN5_CAERE|nr:hypothetical protein CRE_20729 [Caenorhabditis remanei]